MFVSVIVCTYNRSESLRSTLSSLALQRHTDFEVVVVNGPSTDDTKEVVAAYGDQVRLVDNPLANLSVSRNLGITAAAGEIVAFIDDDALPEPSWLEQALPAFDAPDVGGVGGVVVDHTGMGFQYKYSASTRFGEPLFSMDGSFEACSVPGAAIFPYLQGTNALFRRSALAEVGMFDEVFDFYLDEVDVCCRLVDAGYVLRQLPDAAVHHKSLPSARRNERRAVTNWSSTVRNHVYFGYRHALVGAQERDVLEQADRFIARVLRDAEHHERNGGAPEGHVERTRAQCAAARAAGIALSRERADMRLEPVELDRPDFVRFQSKREQPALRLALVGPSLSGSPFGGDDPLVAVSRELAQLGHEVRFLTSTSGVETLDLELGVWVHRLAPVADGASADRALPPAAERELERIADWWQPDVVCTCDGRAPSPRGVTSRLATVVGSEDGLVGS